MVGTFGSRVVVGPVNGVVVVVGSGFHQVTCQYQSVKLFFFLQLNCSAAGFLFIQCQYLSGGWNWRSDGHDVVFQVVVDDAHHGVGAFTAQVVEIVHVYGPSHAAAVTFGLDKVHFDFQRILVLVADPLFALVSIGHHADAVVAFVPTVRRIEELGADLSVFGEISSKSAVV